LNLDVLVDINRLYFLWSDFLFLFTREEIPKEGFGLPSAGVLELYPNIHPSRSGQSRIKTFQMVGRRKQQTTLGRRNSIESIKQPRER